MCGENEMLLMGKLMILGSPPRVRGKHIAIHNLAPDMGITPACAGKTLAVDNMELTIEDHPRVCGENTSEMAYFRG